MNDNELKLDRFLGDCSGFLEALASGSMSRNNMENLASELISDLDAVIVERSTRPQDTESNSAEWVAVGERLPESGREVLVFVHNPYQPKFKSWVIANCRYDGTFWHGKGHTNVTHWQYQYNPAEDK